MTTGRINQGTVRVINKINRILKKKNIFFLSPIFILLKQTLYFFNKKKKKCACVRKL